MLARFHAEIDKQIEKKKHRLEDARLKHDTERQWMLITAIVEGAAIQFFELEGKDAVKMRGISKVAFQYLERIML